MYECMYVCMFVCMRVLHVCMYVCIYVCFMYVCMYVCMYVRAPDAMSITEMLHLLREGSQTMIKNHTMQFNSL